MKKMYPIILSVNNLQSGLHGKETVPISSFLRAQRQISKYLYQLINRSQYGYVFSSTHENAVLNGRLKSKKEKL